MKFVIVGRHDRVESNPNETMVVLREDRWNDFGFNTMFEIEIVFRDGTELDLGVVKIMVASQESGPTPMPGDSFRTLDETYCSLGQDIEYYAKLARLPRRLRDAFLHNIRDAVADPGIEQRFRREEAWQKSLVRFGQAAHALSEGSGVLHGTQTRQGIARFDYLRTGSQQIRVPFRFDDTGELPGRCNVIIGYNGVGKTRLLADIATSASKVGADTSSELVGADSTFGSVVAVSYSAFDTFELPTGPRRRRGGPVDPSSDAVDPRGSETTFFGYTYCGLRRLEPQGYGTDFRQVHELKSPTEIDAEFLEALGSACNRDQGDQAVREVLATIEQEPSFGRIGIRLSDWVDDHVMASSQVQQLSTGHKIVVNIVVQLAAHLRQRSLLLFDEPETHLHPPLLAALLRAIQRLLDCYDSFAILATHSPVVLQEVPAASVHVLLRFGVHGAIEAPDIETYGENVGEITRHVFSLDSSATDYQGVLKALAHRLSLDEIEDLFPLGLSSQARGLVLRARRARR